jgi:hypothetical protein
MFEIGKALLAIGIVIVLIGGLLVLAGRFGLPLGRMPGDIAYRGKNVSFYFPLGSCILVSVVLSVILYLISRFHR